MRVRLTADIGGTYAATWLVSGAVVDLPADTARFLIEQGQAESLEEDRVAVVAPPRNAAKRVGKATPRKGASK